ncbi:uncharacterized protein LOC119984889 isoform X2 [Tripterygium wilfordii]|nr:uncharacterized protein LOC119984889 isoform X2 [Tripterygium wilfordii]
MCAEMAEEEEMLIELEAVQAVYGDDFVVLDSFPPHLHLHLKPRTADISSQQYPEEPPCISLIESKGLDELRQSHLISSIQDKAIELSSCSMLVTLCEAAVEKLTAMNHPDGDCPLCLCPLVSEDEQCVTLPFMKLMSCFHCFHSECIIRWWKWLRTEKETDPNYSHGTTLRPMRDGDHQNDVHEVKEESMGNCPVCRKVFHAKDFEHVLHLVGTHSSQLSSDRDEVSDNEVLDATSENIRRQKFEAILKLQQENSGLIEPKRDLVVLPGMFLPQPVSTDSQTLKEATEQQQPDPTVSTEPNSNGSSYKPGHRGRQRSGQTSRHSRTSRGEANGLRQRDPTVSSGSSSSGSSYRPGHRGNLSSGPTSTHPRTSRGEATGLQQRDPTVSSGPSSSGSPYRPGHRGNQSSEHTSTHPRTWRGDASGTQQRDPTSEPNASRLFNRPSNQGQRNSGRRNQGVPSEGKQTVQWVRKENGPPNQ